MNKNRVIIAGGRDFVGSEVWKDKLDKVLSNLSDICIVSGNAKGADMFGEEYASDRRLPVKWFPPNWKEFGKAAGHIRNDEMADYSTHLIALWDGKSRGTKHMIESATKRGLKVKILRYKKKERRVLDESTK